MPRRSRPDETDIIHRNGQHDGFDRAELLIERARKYAASHNAEELLEAGRTLEEVIVILAQALYVAAIHEPKEGPKPGASPKRRLECYIEAQLPGVMNTGVRTLARSSLDTADSLQRQGTGDLRSAALCLQATSSLVNVLRISTGQKLADETIADLCDRYLENRKVGQSHRYTLQLLARSNIGKKVAAKLTVDDLIQHCQSRLSGGAKPATINQDITFLRGVLKRAKDVWNIPLSLAVLDDAKPSLVKLGLIGRAETRTRRPTSAELDKLLNHFYQRDQHPRSVVPMTDVIRFALYSGRQISEICRLRWRDVKRGEDEITTCIVRGVKTPGSRDGRDETFLLLGPALEIVEKQKQRRLPEDDRIFPYNARTIIANYVEAKKELEIPDLHFQDLRREAAIRLYKAGFSIEQISDVVGRRELNSLKRDIERAVQEDHTTMEAQAEFRKSPAEALTR